MYIYIYIYTYICIHTYTYIRVGPHVVQVLHGDAAAEVGDAHAGDVLVAAHDHLDG